MNSLRVFFSSKCLPERLDLFIIFFLTFVRRCPHKFIIRYLRGITCNGYVMNFIFSLDDYINSVKLGIILEEDKTNVADVIWVSFT